MLGEESFFVLFAKRASKIVVPPPEMLLSFLCVRFPVRFPTNYDVRKESSIST